jgi:hypothetical protein
MTEAILRSAVTYKETLRREIGRATQLLENARQMPHRSKRSGYENVMRIIASKQQDAEQAKLNMIEIEKNIKEINRYLDEFVEFFNETARELNKSRVSTLETIARDQLKNPNISFDPSIGKDTQIIQLLIGRKDDEDYLGGKKKKTKRVKKGGIKSKKIRK